MSSDKIHIAKGIYPGYFKYAFMVILGISFLIVLLISIFVFKLNRRVTNDLISEYQNELLFSTSIQSAMFLDKFHHIYHEFILLSGIDPLTRMDTEKAKPLLIDFLDRHKPYVDTVYILNKNNKLLLSAGMNTGKYINEIHRQNIIKRISGIQKPVINSAFIGAEKRSIIIIYVPLLFNQTVIGSISAWIKWDAFLSWLEKEKSETGCFTAITDAKGNIISYPDPEYVGQNITMLPPILFNNVRVSPATLLGNNAGIVSGSFFHNQQFIMASNPINVGDSRYLLMNYAPYSNISGFIKKHSRHLGLLALTSFFVITLSLLTILLLFHLEKRKMIRLHDELQKENIERRRSQEALGESEERFRGLTELLPITIFEMDPSGQLTFINRNGFNTFGLTKQDIEEGINIFDIISTETRSTENGRSGNIFKPGGPGPSEYTATSKSGIKFPVLFNSNVIFQKDRPIGFRGFVIDISDQMKAKEALKKREKMYHDIFNSVPIGIYVHDMDGYFLETNSNLTDTLGYKEEDFINLNIKDLISEKYRHEFKDYLIRIKEKGSDQGITTISSADGTERVFEYTNTLIESPSGLMTIHGTAREITEKIAADRALQQSEQKYRDVVELSNDGIVVFQDGTAKFYNKRMAEIVGYTPDEIKETSLADYFQPEEIEAIIGRYQRRVSGEKVETMYEADLKHKDGRIISIEANVRLISYKNAPAVLAFVRDVTERKKIEEALRQSEEKHRTIIENIKEGYFETDLSGRTTFANDSFSNMLGYSREEIIGLRYYKDVLAKHDPEAAQKIFDIFNTVYRTGESAFIENYEMITRDGQIRIPELSVSLIKDKDGNPVGYRSIVRDVTEKRKAEQEKIELESRLQQAQKMESIGTLAGGVAHDFNNLLMSMQGNVSLLLYKIDSDHPHYEKLRTIEQHIHDGADLTRQLLGFARGGKYEVKPTDLNELVKKTSNMFARTNKEIRVHDRYGEDIWTVESDQGQIGQVLLNLYVNAWQAMPGGGELYISTENVELDENITRPHAIQPGRFVKISVTDTGTGMEEATRKRIFEPFFTTKEMGRGTGLGLASSYGIIKNHGGIIDVYSEKDKGSTFNIYLPVSEKAFTKTEEPMENILEGKETILFVDDEDRIIESSRELLEALGYHVLPVKNGPDALDCFKANMEKIDMVILDMVMSGMSGGEVFDQLKEINTEVKVLLSSGYSMDGQAADILEKGCDGFIQKPFTLEQISKKIREILDKVPTDKMN